MTRTAPRRRAVLPVIPLLAACALVGCADRRSEPPPWLRPGPETERAPQRIPVPYDGFADFLAQVATRRGDEA